MSESLVRGNKTILIAITNPAFAVRQINWANSMERIAWKPIVLCLCSESRILEIINDKKIKKPDFFIAAKAGKSLLFRFSNRVTSIVNRIPFMGVLRSLCLIVDDIVLTLERIREVRTIIRSNKVSMLLMPDSSPTYFGPLLTAAARKENVVVLTNPLDRDSPRSYAMIYKSDTSLLVSGFSRKLISKFFPKWVIEYQNKRILRMSLQEIISQEVLKISPPKPWHTFGFLEDIVITNNEIQQSFFSGIGVDKEKLRAIGCPELDYLAKKTNDLGSSFPGNYFSDNKPVIVCALPQTHWIAGRPEAEFQSHKEMIDAWIECLSAQSSYNIVISLHPSMPYSDYQYLEKNNLKVAQEDILNLLPICSIFVACLSSTIQFAISLGKPVINYDVYRYSSEIDYLRFTEAKGTVTVLNKNDFLKEIIRITSDSNYYNLLACSQKSISKEWGLLDGKTAYRFTNLIDNLYLNIKE